VKINNDYNISMGSIPLNMDPPDDRLQCSVVRRTDSIFTIAVVDAVMFSAERVFPLSNKKGVPALPADATLEQRFEWNSAVAYNAAVDAATSMGIPLYVRSALERIDDEWSGFRAFSVQIFALRADVCKAIDYFNTHSV